MVNDTECPNCYGMPPKGALPQKCIDCEYCESCRVYHSMREEPAHARTHTCGERSLELEDNNAPAGKHEEIRTTVTVSEFAEFAKLLFRVDDYTLLILREVIANGAASVSEVAKALGLRRQAIHAKVINVIRRFPELSIMFSALMPRLSVARRRYLKNQTRRKKTK